MCPIDTPEQEEQKTQIRTILSQIRDITKECEAYQYKEDFETELPRFGVSFDYFFYNDSPRLGPNRWYILPLDAPKTYYRKLNLQFYLGRHKMVLSIPLKALPYRSRDEYRAYKCATHLVEIELLRKQAEEKRSPSEHK